MKYDPRIHHRRSIRLNGYDYRQAGAYFVTFVVRNRECLFGQVNAGGEIMLSTDGELITACWNETPRHFDNIALAAFVVMPNHLHGIVVIRAPTTPSQRHTPGIIVGHRTRFQIGVHPQNQPIA